MRNNFRSRASLTAAVSENRDMSKGPPKVPARRLRLRIKKYIFLRKRSDPNYSETKFAKNVGLAQQTVNDLMRGKTSFVIQRIYVAIMSYIDCRRLVCESLEDLRGNAYPDVHVELPAFKALCQSINADDSSV